MIFRDASLSSSVRETPPTEDDRDELIGETGCTNQLTVLTLALFANCARVNNLTEAVQHPSINLWTESGRVS